MNLSQTLRALSHRNFRLFFAGQSISLIGTWMQQVAMSWVIYELTRNQGEAVAAFWLGMAGFASQIPAFFLAPVAGVLVDHWNRHRLIILTQTLAMRLRDSLITNLDQLQGKQQLVINNRGRNYPLQFALFAVPTRA